MVFAALPDDAKTTTFIRMRLFLASFAVALCLTLSPVVAQAPRFGDSAPAKAVAAQAVIDAPSTVNPGDLLVLDASRSEAKKYLWLVHPKRTILPVDGGLRCVFASGTPGQYTFILVVSDATGELQSVEHVVTVGVPPPPLPPVVVPTDPTVPPIVTPAPPGTQATLIYEKDTNANITAAVMAGLNKLNRERNIFAELHEAGDNVPERLKVAVAAAKAAGLPALIVHAGGKVIRVTKDPKTVDDVLKAVP